jgi:plasmid stability protein
MANLSLRGIDERTAARLKSEARRRGVSVNALVLELIRQGVGLKPREAERAVHHDLDSLAGTWDEKEAEAFLEAVSDFEQIDKALWR